MKANVCNIVYCESCAHFVQEGASTKCGLTGEYIRWYQFACDAIERRGRGNATETAQDGPSAPRTKLCTKCGKEKPISAFSRNAASLDGLQVWCKDCLNEKAKAYYQNKKN